MYYTRMLTLVTSLHFANEGFISRLVCGCKTQACMPWWLWSWWGTRDTNNLLHCPMRMKVICRCGVEFVGTREGIVLVAVAN